MDMPISQALVSEAAPDYFIFSAAFFLASSALMPFMSLQVPLAVFDGELRRGEGERERQDAQAAEQQARAKPAVGAAGGLAGRRLRYPPPSSSVIRNTHG
jgi:hypothetical protein